MKLHEMTSDQLLAELERRSEALLVAETKFVELETAFKAHEAASYRAMRDAGHSQGDAEKAVRAAPEWSHAYLALQMAVVEEKEARRRYRRAESAMDLWRTEQSTLRAIER